MRFTGTRTAWLEDLENPSGTFADREFALLDTFYASVVEAVLERYFGELSDVDGNGKLLVLLPKEVNKNDDGIAGYVWGGDLFPEDVCATSNQAEIFYGYVPDPAGVFGEPKTRREGRRCRPAPQWERMRFQREKALVNWGAGAGRSGRSFTSSRANSGSSWRGTAA